MFFHKHKNQAEIDRKQVAKDIKNQNIHSNADEAPSEANELPSNSKSYTLLPPYTGKKSKHLLRSLMKNRHCTFPENVQTRMCYTGNKVGTKFNNIKDLVRKCHQRNFVYYTTRSEPDCVEDCTDEREGNWP